LSVKEQWRDPTICIVVIAEFVSLEKFANSLTYIGEVGLSSFAGYFSCQQSLLHLTPLVGW